MWDSTTSTDPDLFDRVIPEPRWARYAIHRLEFFDTRRKWEPQKQRWEPLDEDS